MQLLDAISQHSPGKEQDRETGYTAQHLCHTEMHTDVQEPTWYQLSNHHFFISLTPLPQDTVISH